MDFIGPAFPIDEHTRMRELLDMDILDSDAEDVFDDLTRLAAQICGTPMALVSLVDHDRQWFKSQIGLAPRQTSRSVSFCAHAIHRPDQLFVVPDAIQDVRFAGNPLVLGDPNIRFYAGMPLATGESSAVGTLCVLDTVPRDLTDEQQFALRTIARAVSSHLQARRKVRAESLRDSVTGLPNSLSFEKNFAALADRDRAGACLVIGSDRLTRVGSVLGPDAVESILQEAARRLTAMLPDGAIASFLRRGVFAVFVSGMDDKTAIGHFCEALWSRLREPYRLAADDATEWFGCAWQIGIARYPADGTSAVPLLVAAEQALNSARTASEAYRLFDSVDRDAALAEVRLEGELRQAMRNGEMLLHYQPKVDMRSGQLVGLEALIRWNHPEKGLLLPGAFLPSLEAAGLLPDLARIVTLQAVVDWTKWHRQGLNPPRIAVNIAAAQLYESDIVDFFRNVLALAPSDQSVLSVEVTEGTLIADPSRATTVLEKLRELGVPVSIDDFGTGYSSLSYLASLPVDEIKIDRSFIATLPSDGNQRILVEAIITLASKLGKTVVAEGIETAAQAEALQRLGCLQAQGYHYGKPASFDDIAGRLRLASRSPAALSDSLY